jgi:hypothetical protein
MLENILWTNPIILYSCLVKLSYIQYNFIIILPTYLYIYTLKIIVLTA